MDLSHEPWPFFSDRTLGKKVLLLLSGSTPAGHRDHGPQAGESYYGLLMLLMILYGGRYIGL